MIIFINDISIIPTYKLHIQNSYCLATQRQAVLPTRKKTNGQEAKVRGDLTCINVG